MPPELMPPEIAPFAALAVLAATFLLFATERFPPAVVALAGAGAVLGLGLLEIDEALAAFANPAPLTIACMFILSGALVRVGVLDLVSGAIVTQARTRPQLTLVGLLLFIAAASALMNNTPLVVMMIPIAIRLAAAMGVSASKLLIPISYCSIMGGVTTMIGTSTNLLADGVARQAGLAPFGMFEITGVGLCVAAAGFVYLRVLGRRLLPDRAALIDHISQKRDQIFISEVAVPEDSPLIGRNPLEVELFQREGMRVIDVLRGDASLRRDLGEVALAAGDLVVLRISMAELLTLREARELAMVDKLSERKSVMVEALITPGCRLVGRSLGRLRLRRRYGVYTLAAHRRNQQVGARLEDLVIRVGDTLLLEGDPDDIRRLAEDVDLVDLAQPRARPYRRQRAPVALAALAGVAALSALGVAPIATLAVIAAAIVLLSRALEADEAFAAVDGPVLVLILGMLAIGAALEKTGAVAIVAQAAAPWLAGLPPQLALFAVILGASVMTELVTNNAVAVVLTPVAIALAQQIGLDPRPMVVGVMIGASASFATPIGYQTNTLVYAPGGYRFSDYLRVGAPLNLLVVTVATLTIPLFWPLT